MEIIFKNEPYQKFNPRVTFKNTYLFFIFLGLFFLPILFIWIVLKEYHTSFLFFGFWVLLLFLLITNVVPFNSYYGINRTSLLLKRMTGSLIIPMSAIDAIAILDEESVEKEMVDLQNNEIDLAYRKMEILGAFRSRMSLGNFIKFCTVPIVFTGKKFGNPIIWKKIKAKTAGEFVFIKTKEGEKYLLSPEDVKTFIEAVREKIGFRL